MTKNKKCTMCQKTIEGYGHNGQPVVDGRVCDSCNEEVIKVRIGRIHV